MPPVLGPWSPSKSGLVILGGREGSDAAAVAEDDEADLLAGEEFFDDEAGGPRTS